MIAGTIIMYWLRPSDIIAVENAVLARRQAVTISLDLGLTKQELQLEHGLIITPEGDELAAPALKKDEKVCFFWQDGEFRRIRFVGEETGMIYELVETAGRPMLKVSATPFHKWDFIKRIEADKPKGVVLDAGTGLGYTAIAASKSAKQVITVEMDRHVLQVQQLNPWSRELHAANIKQVRDDVVEYVKECEDAMFDNIILDGGTPRSSGHFFSQEHYNHIRRVLKRGGKLYHYLPDHGVQRGRDFPAEVIARIKKAGFRDVKRFREENYIVAQ
jgi:predicted methyltransferase